VRIGHHRSPFEDYGGPAGPGRRIAIRADAGLDAGKGFDDDEPISLDQLRYSAGTGIRWISPVGPLRLEWGYNLNRIKGEKQSQMEFSIGTVF